MRSFANHRKLVTAISLLTCLSASGAMAALDIAEIGIMTEYELTDGVVISAHPWDFEIEVAIDESGTLDRIDIIKPGAAGVSGTCVQEEPGKWAFDPERYASLSALQADYPQGTYTLEFRDGTDGLLRSVTLDYTVSPPDTAVSFTYPSEDGQTGVSTIPTFAWTIAPDSGDALVAGVDDLVGDDTVYFLGPTALTVTSWTPGPLLPNHVYDLNIDVANLKDWTGGDWPTMTVDGDEFHYKLSFTYFNEISFTTGAHALRAVYRFWSSANSRHFYTIKETEKDKLINTYSHIWTYEGQAYHAYASASQVGLAPVYRFWSESLGGHFYTIKTAERDKLINDYSDVWTYEGPAFYAYPEGSEPGDASPVYRFWSESLGGHFYTIDEAESNKLITKYSHVWTFEGIAWYAYE